jgi:integrase/recombinase XerD
VHTGLRLDELTNLTWADVHLGTGAHVSCLGKGRKQRITPLDPRTVAVLRTWRTEQAADLSQPLCPTGRGRRLSPDAVQRRLTRHAATAACTRASMNDKQISPHTLRHTAAMRLLNAGVDSTVIALWLGHETVATTQVYIHADLAIKGRALARTAPANAEPSRYRPPDTLIVFLENL